MAKLQRDIHQDITDIIIKQIEEGAGRCEAQWLQGGASLLRAANPVTNGRYRGINQLVLYASAAQQRFATGEWASFKQWQSRKAQVRRGERGTPIVFYKQIERENDEGDKSQLRFISHSTVFNAAQVDGYEPDITAKREAEGASLIARAQAFIDATGAQIEESGSTACYMPQADRILMPPRAAFLDTTSGDATTNFYAVLLHELTHWTGGPLRINRKCGKRFGDYAYCGEELIAELGSAFLCAELDISPFPRPDHAAYLGQYLNMMKADKTAIFKAAADASEAMDLLRSMQPASL